MEEKLTKHKIVPVIVFEDAEDAVPVADAFLEGGLDIIEIPLRTPAALQAVRNIKKVHPEMLLGVGTVVTEDQAKRAVDAGVDFGVAPGLNPRTVKIFHDNNTLFLPGVVTPTDIENAIDLGCTFLKFFPAEAVGGVKYLKSISGPYGSLGVKFCPTGGINQTSMVDYLALPTVAAIGGSWLAKKPQIANKEYAVITNQVRSALDAAASVS